MLKQSSQKEIDMSLSKHQKEAVGLLQVGTFLEYFDLMLYVHMAVFLNEIFFPVQSEADSKLWASVAYASTFAFRPLGALLFGYIGDTIGRKSTVILTTFLMSISCVVIANLPTYAQIGVAASWGVTICRIVQGITSMGELTGAQIYLTETIKPPMQYPMVALTSLASALGGMVALGVGTIVMGAGFDWRLAFWVGSIIAIVGTVARSRLRETPEFIDMKKRLENVLEDAKETNLTKVVTNVLSSASPEIDRKPNFKIALAYFCVAAGAPLCFYITFVYLPQLLKSMYAYSSAEVIQQNLYVAIGDIFTTFSFVYMAYYINPFKIQNVRKWVSIIIMLALPFILTHHSSPTIIFVMQVLLNTFSLAIFPTVPLVIGLFPVFSRFRSVSITFALSKALMYSITAFGIYRATEAYSHWGLLVIATPTILAFSWGASYLQKQHKKLNASS